MFHVLEKSWFTTSGLTSPPTSNTRHMSQDCSFRSRLQLNENICGFVVEMFKTIVLWPLIHSTKWHLNCFVACFLSSKCSFDPPFWDILPHTITLVMPLPCYAPVPYPAPIAVTPRSMPPRYWLVFMPLRHNLLSLFTTTTMQLPSYMLRCSIIAIIYLGDK